VHAESVAGEEFHCAYSMSGYMIWAGGMNAEFGVGEWAFDRPACRW